MRYSNFDFIKTLNANWLRGPLFKIKQTNGESIKIFNTPVKFIFEDKQRYKGNKNFNDLPTVIWNSKECWVRRKELL